MVSQLGKAVLRLSTAILICLLTMLPNSVNSAEPANGVAVEFQLAKQSFAQMTATDVFDSSPRTRIVTALGRNSYWLKVEGLPSGGVLDFGALIDEITLFALSPDTKRLEELGHSGDQSKRSGGALFSSHQAFRITEAQSKAILYARIVQDNELHIQPRYLTSEVFAKRERDALLIHAFVTGSATVIIIFNLALGVLLGKLLFACYAMFVTGLVFTNLVLTGIGHAYIWPDSADTTAAIRAIAMLGTLFFFGITIHAFIGRNSMSKFMSRGILIPSAMTVPLASLWWLLSPWQSHKFISLYVIVTVAFLVLMVVSAAVRKNKRARILLPVLLLVAIPTTMTLIFPKNNPDVLHIGIFSIGSILLYEHLFEAVVLLDSVLFSLLFAFQIRLADSRSIQADQKLRRLQNNISHQILDAVDGDRRRIASDLHDTAGQGLLSISTKLMQILKLRNVSKVLRQEITQTAIYSKGVVDDIRRISHDLHPASLNHLGWKSAIEELFSQLASNTEIACKLQINVPEEALSDAQKLHLYRINQELVSNIAKHSTATKCSANYSVVNGMFSMALTDNGQFAPANNGNGQVSIGHIIIDQRVQALGGEWNSNRSDNATLITLNFPISKPKQRVG